MYNHSIFNILNALYPQKVDKRDFIYVKNVPVGYWTVSIHDRDLPYNIEFGKSKKVYGSICKGT